jgi:hypothetical protein
MWNTADVTSDKPITAPLPSILGVSAVTPLVAFYDIHGGKRDVTTRGNKIQTETIEFNQLIYLITIYLFFFIFQVSQTNCLVGKMFSI